MKNFGLMVMFILLGAGGFTMLRGSKIDVHYDNRPKGIMLMVPEETNAPSAAPQAEQRTL